MIYQLWVCLKLVTFRCPFWMESVFKLIIDIFLDNKNNYYVSFQKEIFIQPRESDLRIR